MSQCCVEGCSGVGTHPFPTNPKMRELWIKAMRREYMVLKEHTRLCRRHFTDSDYYENEYHEGDLIRKRLRNTAVPTLFLPKHRQKTKQYLQKPAYIKIINLTRNTNQSSANSQTDPKSEKLATEKNQFPCNACHASFATRCNLYYHKIFHPHYCDVCKKSFKTLPAISIHECTVCPTCEEDFGSVARLNQHTINTKCKRKPKEYCKCCFYCPNCSEQFAIKFKLEQHMQEFKYPCHLCNKCYGMSKEFEAHVQLVHKIQVSAKPHAISRKVWLCSICKARFYDKTALEAHMRRNIHLVTMKKPGAPAIGQLNTIIKQVRKVGVAANQNGAVSRIANKGLNPDKETIGDVEIKEEPDASAPVWLELEVKKEPMEQPNVDQIVEVKQEPEWLDMKIETGTSDVVVKEELVALQMHIKEELEES